MFSGLKIRLNKLQERSGGSEVVLHFANGTTRVLRIRDPLSLILASWDREHARITGRAAPVSRYDVVLKLFDRAVRVEGPVTLDLVIRKTQYEVKNGS